MEPNKKEYLRSLLFFDMIESEVERVIVWKLKIRLLSNK